MSANLDAALLTLNMARQARDDVVAAVMDAQAASTAAQVAYEEADGEFKKAMQVVIDLLQSGS